MLQIKQSPFLHLYFTADKEMVIYDERHFKTTLLNDELCGIYDAIKLGEIGNSITSSDGIISADFEFVESNFQTNIELLLEHDLIEKVA